jgi:uncharacterized Zn finger protein (UPF0148 family)
MNCSICGGPTASDITGRAYCAVCGANCGMMPMPIDITSDTAEYKPLMAEELN